MCNYLRSMEITPISIETIKNKLQQYRYPILFKEAHLALDGPGGGAGRARAEAAEGHVAEEDALGAAILGDEPRDGLEGLHRGGDAAVVEGLAALLGNHAEPGVDLLPHGCRSARAGVGAE